MDAHHPTIRQALKQEARHSMSDNIKFLVGCTFLFGAPVSLALLAFIELSK